MSGDLERLVYSLIDSYHNGGTGHVGGNRYHERHGMVTSYDPDKHLAKVTFQPSGQESGWLSIETGHVGEQYGVAVGLQVGDGKKTGDQVIVRYQEGDLESGKIVQRVHSDDEKPPRVESGEMVLWTKFKNSGGGDDSADGAQGGTGQQIFFKKDGSISVTDGNGATLTKDGNGNVTLACKKFTVNSQGEIDLNCTKVVVNGGSVQVETISGGTGSQDILVRANGSVDSSGG